MARRVLREHIAHEGENSDRRAAVDQQAVSANEVPGFDRALVDGDVLGSHSVVRPVGFLHVLSMQV